jgi:hypothetical protein
MAISLTNDSATIGATEYWLASDSTTKTNQTDDCILQAFIDFGAMVAGDQYKVRIVEQINGGTQRTLFESIMTGAQASPFVSPALVLGEGWEVGVQKLAGTDRSIGWSLRKLT